MDKMNILQYLNIPIENNKNDKPCQNIIEDKESQNLPLLSTQIMKIYVLFYSKIHQN